MNIFFFVNRFPTKEQPYTAFLSVLAEEMVRQGHDITVISPQSLTTILKNRTNILPTYCEYSVPGLNLKHVIKVYRPYTLSFQIGIFHKLTHILNRSLLSCFLSKIPKPDICYAHFWSSASNALSYVKRNQIPLFVATGEDTISIHKRLSNKTISEINQLTKGVICVSTKNMHESIQVGLTSTDKCIVLPNSVDNNLFYSRDKKEIRKQLKIDDDDFVVIFVGRFNYRKGALRLSDAIKQLNCKKIKSIFIGSLIEGNNLEPNCDGILFKGNLPHEQIPNYLCASDVFVLPSLAEGCSNSIVEAMSCGLPIISSNLPFNYDILDDSNSILINPESIDEIAKAINKLYRDNNLRENLSKASLMKAKELTIQKRVSKIITFIRNCLESK